MVRITLNLEKKYTLLVMILFVLLIGGTFVYAYGTNNPTIFGHSAGEIGPAIVREGEFKTDSSRCRLVSGDGEVVSFNVGNDVRDSCSVLISCESDESVVGASSYQSGGNEAVGEKINFNSNQVRCKANSMSESGTLHFTCQASCLYG